MRPATRPASKPIRPWAAALVTAVALVSGTALASDAVLAVGESAVRPRFIAIGTGGLAGVYYPTGAAICRQVNEGRERHGLRCSAESTGGSIFNLEAVRNGGLQFGIAQSDWQYHAWHGTSRFAERGPSETLRSVFSMHAEPFTVVVRADSGIDSFEELAGRRIDAAKPGSAPRETLDAVIAAYALSGDDLLIASDSSGSEAAEALCAGRIDAMVRSTEHPDALITEASNACDLRFLDITGEPIERLIASRPYFRAATIPAGLYHGLERDCVTFGVGATLVTSSEVPDEVVYTLVQAVLGDLDAFRKLHPAFAALEPAEMAAASLSAPLHPGAARYFRERGWP